MSPETPGPAPADPAPVRWQACTVCGTRCYTGHVHSCCAAHLESRCPACSASEALNRQWLRMYGDGKHTYIDPQTIADTKAHLARLTQDRKNRK
jgi:hypothetical protein